MSRLRAWTLESRGRYALVWGGVNATTVCSVVLLAGSSEISARRVVAYALAAFVASVSAQALIGYPRANRNLPTRHT